MLKDVSYIVAAVIEILLPIILAIIIWKKFKVSWAIFFLGMVLFLASLIRTPLNTYLGGLLQSSFRGETFYILFGAMAGLTAGIFEEGVRCIALGAAIKPRDYYKGVMYGIGHGGGGEAMVFIGFSTLANFIIYKFFPNILPINILPQIQAVVWWLPLVGAMERILAIAIQIAFSVLIMYAFMSKKYYIIAVTIILHAVVNFAAFYINYKFGMWYSELSVFIFAIIGIVIIVLLRPKNCKHALE
ncbi:MAG: YhfC family intramembrane metalloprotease [Actinobacteria bacterium]|nr:YhfC family intramembrane metalloprotease [Actinomycetota bacterium]